MRYHIVAGVDGSRHSAAALRWAVQEAKSHQGEVTALFVWQIPFLSFPGAFEREELETRAKEFIIETVSAIVPRPAVPLRTVVAEGDPVQSLTEAAKGADLLALGTRGHSPIAGLLLGAVCQAAAAVASCPVVLVKATDATDQR
jgi:nucleotide-binding universal stress UspA family protein